MADESKGPTSLSGVVERTISASKGQKTVSVQRLVEAMGPSSIVALLLLPALVVATPLSGIPGLSSVGGILIALIAVQIVIGRTQAWLPAWLMRRKIPGPRLEKAMGKLRGPASHVDHHLHKRFKLAAGSVARRVLGFVCMVLGLGMPLLELVPFTSSVAATAVGVLALALLAGDGLLALAGFGMIMGIGALILWFV